MGTFALSGRHCVPLALAVGGLLAMAGCAGHGPAAADESVRFSQENPGVPQPGQKLFATPDEAAGVLKDAVAARDRRTLIAVFGPEGRQLIFTGDRVQEDNDLTAFAGRMSEYLRVNQEAPNRAVLYVGSNNWPFPIPIVKGNGGWFFDTVAGRDELLNRVIGENELNAVAVCRAYVVAQKEYARKDRMPDRVTQYAQRFMSTEGKRDGLYWPVGPDEEVSPMGPLVAEAQMEGYLTQPANGKHHPYRGYFFHILTAQGEAAPGGKMSYIVDGRLVKGFAMVASPDKWGASGIMTFIVNQDGKVYQKNLGEQTRDVVKSMTEYNPDNTWEEVKD
jgi:hypothetical protein